MGRVLLVDDEPALLFTLKELLKARGHEAALARSSREALALVEGVDAVVTDFAMPDMDGVQLLQELQERDASLPVVLLQRRSVPRPSETMVLPSGEKCKVFRPSPWLKRTVPSRARAPSGRGSP